MNRSKIRCKVGTILKLNDSSNNHYIVCATNKGGKPTKVYFVGPNTKPVIDYVKAKHAIEIGDSDFVSWEIVRVPDVLDDKDAKHPCAHVLLKVKQMQSQRKEKGYAI